MITQRQYEAVKPIYEAMFARSGGVVDVEAFIAKIEADPTLSSLFFDADQGQVWRRYQLERAREFIQTWAYREAKQIIGVPTRLPRLSEHGDPEERVPTVYRPLDHAWQDTATAEAALRYYRHGLAEIRKHAPLCLAWGQSYEDLCTEVQGILIEIRGQMTTPELMPVM